MASAQTARAAAAAATVEAAPAATAAAQAAAIATLEANATATALQARVEQAVAATVAARPTATPVPPTNTPEPPATSTPLPAPAPQPPVVVVSPQYVPAPVPHLAPGYDAPQFAIDAINSCNNAYTVAKWTLNVRDLEAGVAGQELADGRENVQSLSNNRTRVVSTWVRGNLTSWRYASPTRVLVGTDEVWQDTNYDADTYAVKRTLPARLYHNDYTIDLRNGRWIVTIDSVPNPNGDPI